MSDTLTQDGIDDLMRAIEYYEVTVQQSHDNALTNLKMITTDPDVPDQLKVEMLRVVYYSLNELMEHIETEIENLQPST